MNTRQVLTTAITGFILAIILPIIFRRLEAANRRKACRVGDIAVLQYPIAAKALAILAIVMSACLIYAAIQTTAPRRTLAIAVYGIMSLLFLILPLEFFSRRIEFNDHEIVIRCIWHRQRRIPWADVMSTFHLPREKAWVLESKTYGKVKLSTFLEGLHELQMAAAKYGKAA